MLTDIHALANPFLCALTNINTYVSKFVYFSYFWTIVGSSKYAIVTTNSNHALRRITQHSTDHDNIQLGGEELPMYLAKYFFPFGITFEFSIYLLKIKR
jgi:hypothetical protein